MRVLPPSLPPTIFETFPRVARTASKTLPLQQQQYRKMADTSSPDFAKYGIETTSIPTAPGVSLDASQKVILGSILDLFAGRPSKRKLTLWSDDASFHDPLTNAEGRKQFEAQWYGLKVAFSEIERLHAEVRSAGDPLEMDLKTRYKVKGLGTEQTIDSRITVSTTGQGEGMRIKQVMDKWDGEIQEGPVKKALRGLNSVTVPMLVR